MADGQKLPRETGLAPLTEAAWPQRTGEEGPARLRPVDSVADTLEPAHEPPPLLAGRVLPKYRMSNKNGILLSTAVLLRTIHAGR
eukprot:2376278-Prymnesium_polylepis.2